MQVFEEALRAVDGLFSVALQEELAVSAMLLARRLAITAPSVAATNTVGSAGVANYSILPADNVTQPQDRNRGKAVNDFAPAHRAALLADKSLAATIGALNSYDRRLYAYGECGYCTCIAPPCAHSATSWCTV